MALFVETDRAAVNATATQLKDTDFIDFGGGSEVEQDPANQDPGTETIRWDADVVVLPGPAPVLVIAADGIDRDFHRCDDRRELGRPDHR